jgi:hypothetical protein
MSWKQQAGCRGRGDLDWDGFSPETVLVCVGCRVRVQCLTEALWEPETPGTWGMTSEAQRRQLRAKKTTVAEVWDANVRNAELWAASQVEGDVPEPLQEVAEVVWLPSAQGSWAF